MAPETRLPSGTVSFLFTDIEGSTRLWEADPEAMRLALAEHDRIFRELIPRHGGAIFKTIGDAVCAAFSRPEEAVRAAADGQRLLAGHDWPAATGEIRVRMGIHTGTAQERDNDYLGRAVNRVARFMSIGHGGQILVSGTTAALIAPSALGELSLRDLGEHRLRDLAEPETAFQVVGAGLRADFPPLTSLDSHPNNLPLQISSFVGRTRELAEVDALLGAHRLVTLLGPGGIGKTRLSLQIAAQAVDRFADGAWFVELAPIEDPGLIEQTIAETLHVRERPPEEIGTTLVRALERKRMLLVLDNAELLTARLARVVRGLLARCPSLHVLVTSREPLRVAGERRVHLAPLPVGRSAGVGDGLADAAQLFIERASEVRQNLLVDAAALATIDRICTRVEGMPLAVELAAARVATFSLEELDRRLSDRFAVLVSRDPTREERHRALRITIDWSYRFLSLDEQRFARALSVFAGTFTLAACEAIAPSGGAAADLLEALADKSLVTLHHGGGEVRYGLYDLIRDYLADELRDAGEAQAVAEAHARAFLDLAAAEDVAASTDRKAAWLDRMAVEAQNLRAALQWAIGHDPARAAAALVPLTHYWNVRQHSTEALDWFNRVLALRSIAPDRRATLLDSAAGFACNLCRHDEAASFASKALVAHRALGNPLGAAESRFMLGVIGHVTGNEDAAAEHYWRALDDFREAGNPRGEAKVLMNLTLMAFGNRDLPAAAQLLDRAAAVVEQLGDAVFEAHITGIRGALLLRRGELDEALRLHLATLAFWRRLQNDFAIAEIQNRLSAIYLALNDLGRARETADESYNIARTLDAPQLIIDAHEAFCEIALRERRFAEGAREFAAARALREAHRFRHSQIRDLAQIEATLRTELGAGYDAALASAPRSSA